MKYHVSDHQITLFYFFKDDIKVSDITYKKLKDIGLSSRHSAILNKPNAKLPTNKLWEEQPYTDLSADFIPNINTMFNDKDRIIKTWQLKAQALNLLNGKSIQANRKNKDEASCAKLGLHLNATAKSRLKKANCHDQPCLSLQNIFFHQFKTKYGVARVELALSESNPSPLLIQEVVYALARFNTLYWEEPDNKYECNTRTTLGLMVRQLLQHIDTQNNKKIKTLKEKRVYTHTYVQLRKETPESSHEVNTKQLLIRLAKHYNDDYILSDNCSESTRIINDFETTNHLITHEGSATLLILNDKAPDFLNNYKNKVIKLVHNPLHLLSFYTENAIKHYIADGTVWLDSHCPEQQLQAKLQQYQLQLLNLNNNFFLPVISSVDTHNTIQKELIRVNQLDKQHQKISEYNQTISQLFNNCREQQKLKDSQAQQKEKREQLKAYKKRNIEYCKIGRIGVSAVAFYTVFQIAEAIMKLIKQEDLFSSLPDFSAFLNNHSIFIELSFSLAVALTVLRFGYKHCEHLNKE